MNSSPLITLQARIHLGLMNRDYHRLLLGLFVGFVLCVFAQEALASGGKLPWEDTICQVASSMAGTTARAIAVIAIVVCGLMLAFGEMNGVFKTFLGLIIGISMALMASKWVVSFGGENACGIA